VKAASPNLDTSGKAENAAVAQIDDAISYRANASVFKMANAMIGSVLNVVT